MCSLYHQIASSCSFGRVASRVFNRDTSISCHALPNTNPSLGRGLEVLSTDLRDRVDVRANRL
jgi:hypothetical protein